MVKYAQYYLWFVSMELLLLFMFSCSAPKERRGDWMEHMNYKQFNFSAPMMHWDRQNYYTPEELGKLWVYYYEKAQKNLDNKEE